MLNGAAVLIVEAEFLIALDLQRMLEFHGAGEVLMVRDTFEAEFFKDKWSRLGLAIIEASNGAPSVVALVAALNDLQVPVVLCSADSAPNFGAPELSQSAVLTKPMLDAEMARALETALASKL
jgi:DNA-binding LytR/AlgR family response regulator